ncbi:MAG: formylglycine-generating enzyme family protein [Acidobacteria bacterium]|nr:formylglycine-generating enzyme family protein [Acidobacteriota bacterium]
MPPGTEFRDCDDCPEMISVSAGTFQMGCLSGGDSCSELQGPVREVDVDSFALGKYEVTRAQFAAFVSATGHVPRGEPCLVWVLEQRRFARDQWHWEPQDGASWRAPGWRQQYNEPVVCVSWEDASAYVRWLSEVTGERYRLPAEAEWEYAARAGTTTAFYWGDDATACVYANGPDRTSEQTFRRRAGFSFSFSSCTDGAARTALVGSFEPNAFGLYDMAGNVSEWVEDCWHRNYAGAPRDGSAWTSGGNCGGRVIRGGAWGGGPWMLRSATRDWSRTGDRSASGGFRVARTLD